MPAAWGVSRDGSSGWGAVWGRGATRPELDAPTRSTGAGEAPLPGSIVLQSGEDRSIASLPAERYQDS